MNYGYETEDGIATQVILRSYSPGDVGSIALSNGGFPVGEVITGVTQLVGAGIGAAGTSAAAKQAAIQAQAEAEAAAAQAQAQGLLASVDAQKAQTYAMYGAGALVLVSLIGGGVYYLSTR